MGVLDTVGCVIRNLVNWARNNLRVAVPLVAAAAAVVAFLAFGVFGIHTKFLDDEVNESGPVFTSGAASELPTDIVDQEMTDEMNDVMESENIAVEVAVTEPMPETVDAAAEAGTVVTLVEGTFVDRSHPGTGVAKVLNDGSAQRFLRFDPFETDNGPDLFVYLTRADAAADAAAFGVDGDFVNLGRLKGNVGEQNYEIPVDVDLADFGTVVVWCDRFSVAFTAADLG
jgi:hypothetical protein